VTQAQRTLAAIEKVAVHLDAEIDPLAASALRALDSVDRTMEVASTSIKHVDQGASSALTEVQALAADGRQQLAARGAELSRALVSADKTLQAIDGLVLAANSLIAPRSQARSDLEAMLRDLAATASQLRDFSHTIERDPSVVLRGKGFP
jgi:paraquat-inducible protein B